LANRDDADVLAVGADKPDFTCLDAMIDAVSFFLLRGAAPRLISGLLGGMLKCQNSPLDDCRRQPPAGDGLALDIEPGAGVKPDRVEWREAAVIVWR
jgi:hypothetical protein